MRGLWLALLSVFLALPVHSQTHLLSDLAPGEYEVWISPTCNEGETDSTFVAYFSVADSMWVADPTHPDGGSWVPSDGTGTFVLDEDMSGCWRVWPRQGVIPPSMWALQTPDYVGPVSVLKVISFPLEEDSSYGAVWSEVQTVMEPTLVTVPKLVGLWRYDVYFYWPGGYAHHTSTFSWGGL